MKKIPNIITIIRLLMVPVYCVLLYKQLYLQAGILFVVASVTDILDGYLARKLNAISNFGKLADPAADKALQMSSIILFCILGKIEPWIMIVLLAKDLFLVIGALLYKFIYNITVFSNLFGKMAAFLFNVIIAAILFFNFNNNIINILMIIIVVLELIAMLYYTFQSFRILKEHKQQRST